MEDEWSDTDEENSCLEPISNEAWSAAEDMTARIISCIHPNFDSEETRRSIIEYLEEIITSKLNCKVFPYGSFPLKTYLPDGDIDLTIINNEKDDTCLAETVFHILMKEESNINAAYKVNHIQFINAQVKLVKCVVDDICVDISFNQLSGLCALAFLEQIDRAIAHNHILKRSIILIKAWCYYEGHILGSQHGLISTYALEILVLHLFNRFNLASYGPLEVFNKFLNYFCEYDWETSCISLSGPPKSSFRNVVVTEEEIERTQNILTKELLEMFSVPSDSDDKFVGWFPQKIVNIIDPLKEDNNLGKSVYSIVSYHRICCALRFGASQLDEAFELPVDEIGYEISQMFCNTIKMHGGGHIGRPPCLQKTKPFRADDCSALSPTLSSENKTIPPEDLEFLEIVKARWSDDDMIEFRDLLSLRRIEEPMISYTTELRKRGSDNEKEVKSLSDLTGDLDSHLRNMLYAQQFTGLTTSNGILPPQSTPTPQWDSAPHEYSYSSVSARPFPQWGAGHYMRSSTHHGPTHHLNSDFSVGPPPHWRETPQMVNDDFELRNATTFGPLPSHITFGSEHSPRTRGLGTFFPNPDLYPRQLGITTTATGSITGLGTQSDEEDEKQLLLKDDEEFPPLSPETPNGK